MPHIFVSHFRACILAIFWLISLEEHFVEFRVLTVDTYDCPPCTWAEAFLYKPLDLRTSPPMNCLTNLVIAATPGVSVSQRACAVDCICAAFILYETTLKESHSLSSRAPFCLKTISMKLHVMLILFILPVFLFLFVLYR